MAVVVVVGAVVTGVVLTSSATSTIIVEVGERAGSSAQEPNNKANPATADHPTRKLLLTSRRLPYLISHHGDDRLAL